MEVKEIESINNILLQKLMNEAWFYSTSRLKSNNIQDLKISDWDVLSSDIEIALAPFHSEINNSIKVPTGEAFYKLLKNGISNKTRSHFVLVLFILIKKGLLNDSDKPYLNDFYKYRNYFLSNYLSQGESLKINLEKHEAISITKTSSIFNSFFKTVTQFLFGNIWKFLTAFLGIALLIISYLFIISRLESSAKNAKVELQETRDPGIKLTYHYTNDRVSPCEVIFNYDLSQVKYSEAYIDFGLNKPFDHFTISKPIGEVKIIYTGPQGRLVKFIVDNKEKKFYITINSVGWIGKLDNYHLESREIIRDGIMHFPFNKIPSTLLEKGVFYINYQLFKDFNYNADDLTFEVKVKNPKNEGGLSCFDAAIDLNGEIDQVRGILSFNILSNGCEKFAKIKVGDAKLPTGDEILINSGADLEDWRIIKTVTRNQTLRIFVDSVQKYDIPYTGKIGKLKFLQIGFMGIGSVDWVKLSPNDGTPGYFEDFNQ